MKVLINEPPLQVLPSLAVQIGLNKAIFLQQLHYRLQISRNVKDGFTWVYKTAEEWHEEEFPFWSVSTIKRIIKDLETDKYIISTSSLNRLKMDRTKWYRINMEKLDEFSKTHSNRIVSKCDDGKGQSESNESVNLNQSHCVNLARPIPKEDKSNKDNVELTLDPVAEIIHYLNKKTGKDFRANTRATQRMVNARLTEGYQLQEFFAVIDAKTKQWINDKKMNVYLRPSTLFTPTNFENYLNESGYKQKQKPAGAATSKPIPHQPPELDFGKGEES